MPYSPELAIVIPVYNEAENLPALLRDWRPVFQATGVPYRIVFIDDGSTDGSLALLRTLQTEYPTLSVHTQPNSGHGAAILKGYHLAPDAEWIFQIDSDHQLDTAAFSSLWKNREQYDLLVAERLKKNATRGRQQISALSAVIVRLLFGPGVRDVNCPYRLMRAELLHKALQKIPADSFAPNILLTAWFVRKKSRIFTTTTENRKGDGLRRSRVSRPIFRGAIMAAFQTILFRIRL
jgi:glycosyltransferase involved in cell wall biosynthesis